jgi:hypothetical protein
MSTVSLMVAITQAIYASLFAEQSEDCQVSSIRLEKTTTPPLKDRSLLLLAMSVSERCKRSI